MDSAAPSEARVHPILVLNVNTGQTHDMKWSLVSLWSRFVGTSAGASSKISISSPHPVSNLRLFKYKANPEESEAEKQVRKMSMELQEWNQNYWENHNRLFNHEKEKFINSEQKVKGVKSADELAVFYKHFLDENRSKHIQYSIEWYSRLFRLLTVAMKAVFRGRHKS